MDPSLKDINRFKEAVFIVGPAWFGKSTKDKKGKIPLGILFATYNPVSKGKHMGAIRICDSAYSAFVSGKKGYLFWANELGKHTPNEWTI